MLVHRVRVFSTRTTDGSLHLKPHILNTTCLHLCWCRVATHINAFHCTWNLDKTTSDMEKCNWTANPSRSSKSGTRSRVYICIHWWHHSSMAAHLLNDYFFNSAAVVACEVGRASIQAPVFQRAAMFFQSNALQGFQENTWKQDYQPRKLRLPPCTGTLQGWRVLCGIAVGSSTGSLRDFSIGLLQDIPQANRTRQGIKS